MPKERERNLALRFIKELAENLGVLSDV